MIPQHIDRRAWLTAPLRGGPPWTTKARLVLALPVIIVVAAIFFPFGAAGSLLKAIAEFFDELAHEVRQAWDACDAEKVRRLTLKAGS